MAVSPGILGLILCLRLIPLREETLEEREGPGGEGSAIRIPPTIVIGQWGGWMISSD